MRLPFPKKEAAAPRRPKAPLRPESPPARDWTVCLLTDCRERLGKTLTSLGLERLQRYPPPKRGGLPAGHELRILRRFLAGGPSVLDPSGLSGAYRRLAGARERLLFRAFVLGEPLGRPEWDNLIGSAEVDFWLENGLVGGEDFPAADSLRCAFRVIPIGSALLAADPLEVLFPGRVHIGLDSLNMIEFLARQELHGGQAAQARLPALGRYLDVGTGAGAILLQYSRGFDEAVGIDINPRAVEVAAFNARLSGDVRARIETGDIFAPGRDRGRFDLITWNVPYMFFPESYRERAVDGYGGEMGIGLTLRFFEEALPGLLAEAGACFLLTSSPILANGSSLLEDRLAGPAVRLGLNVRVQVRRSFWVKELRSFHRSHGIVRFESVFLEIERGAGRVSRRSAPPAGRAVDFLRRRLLYR